MVNKFTKWEVLTPFLNDYRKSLILADFERELDKPHQTIKRYIEGLLDERVLEENSRSGHSSYRLNLRNPFTLHHLSIAERIRTVDFLEDKRILKRLYEKMSPFFSNYFVSLFGSYAVGREGNDIDLFMVGEENEKLDGEVSDFSETYMDIHLVLVEDREELDKDFIRELHKKHIVFNGSDYFVKLFGELYGETGLV